MDGAVNTPAADHLFLVNLNPALLSTETSTVFHHLVAKLLFSPSVCDETSKLPLPSS